MYLFMRYLLFEKLKLERASVLPSFYSQESSEQNHPLIYSSETKHVPYETQGQSNSFL